jgi:S1-C subfamily serine protease
MRTSAYLGTVPDYGGDDIKGVKLADVRPNGPAAKGGIKPGDVIIKFAGQTVTGINGYTEYLGASKPGDNVDIVVLRDGKEVTLKVTIGTRPGQ